VSGSSDDEPTIENRVYLFKALAAAFLDNAGALLASQDDDDRSRAVEALAELARVSCIVADAGEASPSEVRNLILDDDDEPRDDDADDDGDDGDDEG
jgi:hypothetical protein